MIPKSPEPYLVIDLNDIEEISELKERLAAAETLISAVFDFEYGERTLEWEAIAKMLLKQELTSYDKDHIELSSIMTCPNLTKLWECYQKRSNFK